MSGVHKLSCAYRSLSALGSGRLVGGGLGVLTALLSSSCEFFRVVVLLLCGDSASASVWVFQSCCCVLTVPLPLGVSVLLCGDSAPASVWVFQSCCVVTVPLPLSGCFSLLVVC